MADDFDVEALLEAPYKESGSGAINGSSSNGKDKVKYDESQRPKSRENRDRSRSRSKNRSGRKRSNSKERRRSRDRERKKSRSRDRERKRTRSRERSRERSRDKRRRSRSRERRHRSRSWSKEHKRRSRERRTKSPTREEKLLVDADQRTVLCMQLSQRVTQRDLESFFGAVGKVREVRLIVDNKTRRHKGVAYIEFREPSSVPLALALNGQKLGGYPIQIQPTHAQKNRPNAVNNTPANPPADPISHPPIQRRHFPNMPAAIAMRNKITAIANQCRLYVGSLHFHITEDMLRSIFEPFGTVNKIELIREPETQRSKGYGFVTFEDADNAKRAIEQLNGFELAGRPMKVNHANERNTESTSFSNFVDSEFGSVDFKATNRMQLMAKLAEGTGMQVPQMSTSVLFCANTTAVQPAINVEPKVSTSSAPMTSTTNLMDSAAPNNNSAENINLSIATQCFMLSNMFDPTTEQGESWHEEIRSDVIEECRQHGGALHAFVDKMSQGNVYIKCPNRQVAAACVSALHGRWFSGRLVTAAYIPENAYHQLFPESLNAVESL